MVYRHATSLSRLVGYVRIDWESARPEEREATPGTWPHHEGPGVNTSQADLRMQGHLSHIFFGFTYRSNRTDRTNRTNRTDRCRPGHPGSIEKGKTPFSEGSWPIESSSYSG